MGMFNFVLDSFKGEIFGFKVKRQDLIAGTVFFPFRVCDTHHIVFNSKSLQKVNKTQFSPLLWVFCMVLTTLNLLD